jgi:NADH-quinone oxidoreductase subunit J
MATVIFWIFALVAVGSALLVVVHRDPVKATLSLVATLFSTGVLFVLLGAPFIGTLQLLIYTGAILVLFLFVIMLLNLQRDEANPGADRGQRIAGVLGALALGGMGTWAVWRAWSDPARAEGELTERFVSLHNFSDDLFKTYLLPFEIVGLLLLVAVIGAFIVAKRPTDEEGRS